MKKQYMLVVDFALWLVFVASLASAQTSTWTNPTVDRVVPAGQTVVLDSHAVARNVTVNGTLLVARDVDTSLRLTGQLYLPTVNGLYDAGVCGSDPVLVNHRLIFALQQSQTFVGGPNYSADPGLWARGVWRACGREIKRVWGELAADAAAGSTTVVVNGDATDWPQGWKILVTPSNPPDGWSDSQAEIRTIQQVSGGTGLPTTITLTTPLTYAHSGTGLERAEVGLLTRNISIESEIAGVSDATLTTTQSARKFACARLFEGGRAYLSYVQFVHMGAYDVNGCFPLHWHRLRAVGYGQYGLGLSFFETGFRSVNIHESDGVRVEDTISYDSGNGIPYWVQTDPASFQVDHQLVHNLIVDHHAKDPGGVFGEAWDEAYGISSGFSDHEFIAGNSVSGWGYGAYGTAGYGFFAGVRGTPSEGVGTLPRVFIKNEAHNLWGSGLISGAQRDIPFTDVVDTHTWRNNWSGIVHGGYDYRLKFHRARLVQNPSGFFAFNNTASLQDATIIGRGLNAPPNPDGRFNNGFGGEDAAVRFSNNSGSPYEAKWFARVSISDLAPGHPSYGSPPGVGFLWPGENHRSNGLCATQETVMFPGGECGTALVKLANVTFGANLRPRMYVGTYNASDALFDYDLGALFFRTEQTPPNGGFQLYNVPGQTAYDSAADALKTPFSALGASLAFVDATRMGNVPADFTVPLTYNPPPTVALTHTLAGSLLTLTASASSDTTKVEYYVDYTKVGETTTAPHQVTVDLGAAPRRYAYLYARAFDGVMVDAGCHTYAAPIGEVCDPGYAQRAYSPVIELGPEQLAAPPTIESLQQQIQMLLVLLAQCQAQ